MIHSVFFTKWQAIVKQAILANNIIGIKKEIESIKIIKDK